MRLFSRKKLEKGLEKSSKKIGGGITGILTKRKLDEETLEDLEELLISADLGVELAAKVITAFSNAKFGKQVDEIQVKEALATIIADILQPYAKELSFDADGDKPKTYLFIGVNGSGKTTSVGKLSHEAKAQGKTSTLAACDTFRAAAIEQLEEWASRAGTGFVKGKQNSDPASVAHAAFEQARAESSDLLFIDTAGRLHNNVNLMAELKKIKSVINNIDPSAPHETILVLDGTVGQNAINQVQQFNEQIEISGLIINKLDGTSKAGAVIALAEKFEKPIYAIGVGEGIDDMKPFDATHFARNLVGLS